MAVDTDKLMNDARCIDKCVPDGEKLSVLISVLYQLLQNGVGSGLNSTPQFVRLGIGEPADGSIPLVATLPGPSAGTDVTVAQFDAVTGNPVFQIGNNSGNATGFSFELDRVNNQVNLKLSGFGILATLDQFGDWIISGNLIAGIVVSLVGDITSKGNVKATTGVFKCGAETGITGTMTTASLVGKSLTFTGGIITGFA